MGTGIDPEVTHPAWAHQVGVLPRPQKHVHFSDAVERVEFDVDESVSAFRDHGIGLSNVTQFWKFSVNFADVLPWS